MPESSQPSWRTVAEVLAVMPDAYRRLLELHRGCMDGMCRACTVGGTGARHTRWPCSIHKLAKLAQEIHDRPLRGRPG